MERIRYAWLSIQLDSPKLGCIPIRPFLIFGSSLGTFITLSYLVTEPLTIRNVILCALGASFNVCLVYGALKYNDKALKYGQMFVIFLMIISTALLCFMPVSVTASDDQIKKLTGIFDERTLLEINGNVPEQDSKKAAGRKFLAGFVAGEMVVLFLIVYILSSYMEYVMIKRLRKFIAARKGRYENVMLA
ncbi:hypothetical protein B9Z55_021033 [Caenorhabditis nigoni]|nr:hypothetical protein B9Z55_021033 [Caenorhabditis nigoni]